MSQRNGVSTAGASCRSGRWSRRLSAAAWCGRWDPCRTTTVNQRWKLVTRH